MNTISKLENEAGNVVEDEEIVKLIYDFYEDLYTLFGGHIHGIEGLNWCPKLVPNLRAGC